MAGNMDSELLLKFIGYFPDYLLALSRALFVDNLCGAGWKTRHQHARRFVLGQETNSQVSAPPPAPVAKSGKTGPRFMISCNRLSRRKTTPGCVTNYRRMAFILIPIVIHNLRSLQQEKNALLLEWYWATSTSFASFRVAGTGLRKINLR